jgi:hypothetical protein
MTRPSPADVVVWLALAAVLALAGVNVAWAIEFWSRGQHAIIYQIFGVAMIVVELTGLVVAAHLREIGLRRHAQVWFAVFTATLLLNVLTDFAAIMTRSAEEVENASRARATYDQALVRQTELQTQITEQALLLQARGGARPAAAIEAQLIALQRQSGAYVRSDRAVPRRLGDRIANAEADLAVAQALADARRELAQQREIIALYGQRPELPPHLLGAANLLASLGVSRTPEQVQAWFSLLIAAIVKIAVVLGPWAILPLLRSRGPVLEIGSETEAAAPGPPPVRAPPPQRRQAGTLLQAFDEFENLSRQTRG